MLCFTPGAAFICVVVLEFLGQLATLMKGVRALKVNNCEL